MITSTKPRTLIGLALAATAFCGHATEYTYSTLALPGADSTVLWSVSNTGLAAGSGYFGIHSKGFIADLGTGQMTLLDGPEGALGTTLFGLSDGGLAVGSYYDHLDIDSFSGEYAG